MLVAKVSSTLKSKAEKRHIVLRIFNVKLLLSFSCVHYKLISFWRNKTAQVISTSIKC